MTSSTRVEATLLDNLLVDLQNDNCTVCYDNFLTVDPDDGADQGIAVLGCGHAYHNQCVTMWLNTANTCPVCRHQFNYFEVIEKPGDTLCTAFQCEDKRQVGEFDAAEWAAQNPEDGEDADLQEDQAGASEMCPICRNHETQNVVLICDGCEACMHPICAGLSEIPSGDWYCPDCTAARQFLAANDEFAVRAESALFSSPLGPLGALGPLHVRRTQRDIQRSVDFRHMARALENHERARGRRERRRAQREQRGRSRPDSARPVWNNVSSRIHAASGLDLDFVDDDPAMAHFRRLQRHDSEERRELLEWEERLASANRRIAGTSSSRPGSAGRDTSFSSRAGSRANSRPASRSGSAARSSRSHSRPRSAGSRSSNTSGRRQPERRINEAVGPSQRRRTTPAHSSPAAASSPELDLAWDDFDRAQSMINAQSTTNPTTNTRKRRAEDSTDEYADEQSEHQEPERKLKRPRTRAVLDTARSSSSSSAQTPPLPAVNTSNEPSFLASLLREVESATGEDRFHWSPAMSAHEPATSPSTYHLSPATSPSPVSSNYYTSRGSSITPPPQQPVRTEPALSTTFRTQSPLSTAAPVRRRNINHASPTPEIRQPRPRRAEQFVAPRSEETFPVRATMPIEAKEAISSMVKAALGPHWRSGELNKDQYFDINRGVSRQMYEIIGEEYANIGRDQHVWERVVSREVAVAVRAVVTPPLTTA